MDAPRPAPPHAPAPLRRALPALRNLGLAARVVRLGALVGALSLLWAGAADVRAAPQIPSRLDLHAARIVVEGAPIAGQYLMLCQEADGISLRGPWRLEAGDVASVPMHALGVACWVQASETREGELMAIYETPRFTVWRLWMGEVGQ